MEYPNVMLAFEMLLKELSTALESTRQQAAAAIKEGKYNDVQTQLDEAQRIEKCIADIQAIQGEWNSSGSKSRQKKRKAGARLPRGECTPQNAYRLPILRALVALGGKARMSEVLERVYEEMKPYLKPVDLDTLPLDPNLPRWRLKAQWERFEMVKDGLLQNDSPRGIWAISEKGRKYLAENKG